MRPLLQEMNISVARQALEKMTSVQFTDADVKRIRGRPTCDIQKDRLIDYYRGAEILTGKSLPFCMLRVENVTVGIAWAFAAAARHIVQPMLMADGSFGSTASEDQVR
jgi:hypothetical protein